MAQVTLKNLVIAPLATEPNAAAPTYSAGLKAGHLMRANVSWNRSDVKLHGDDKLVAKDNSITSGTITVGTTYLSREALSMLFDYTANGTGENARYVLGADSSPHVGVGYVWKDELKASNPYTAVWFYKVQFSMNEDMNTRGENKEYGTPEMEGTIFGVFPDATGNPKFREEGDFATEAAAIAYINGKAGIT